MPFFIQFDNYEGWQRVMSGEAVVDGVLFYDVGEEVLVQRLLKRGESSGRSDDNIDVILKRLRTYNDSTVGVVDHFTRLGKVTRIDGTQPVDVVFEHTRAAVEPTVRAELAAYSQLLLDSISRLDWAAYNALVDDSVSCFEPEAAGLLVGKQAHKEVFAAAKAAKRPMHASKVKDAHVTLLGPKHALVAYERVGGSKPAVESRVWRLDELTGRWVNVHFHRSVV